MHRSRLVIRCDEIGGFWVFTYLLIYLIWFLVLVGCPRERNEGCGNANEGLGRASSARMKGRLVVNGFL